jgi:1-deoxy-D-xylulose-5-phosphate reductoisomerase
MSSKTKKIVILGSTGSIGRQTLDVIAASSGRFEVVALSAGENIKLLLEQINLFKPTVVCVRQEKDVGKIKEVFPNLQVFFGESGLVELAKLPEADIVLVSIVGVAALLPTIEAIKHKKDIALASKEVLVAAGLIVMDLVKKYGVKMLPVDSEHAAIMQCFEPEISSSGYLEYPVNNISKIILTASGGAFHDTPKEDLHGKTSKDALRHPNWQMGKKITIDSATLMNKGLEVIEAHWLFDLPYKKIEVVIHPQSIIHSLVEYIDGSVLAQLGAPDMRIPIQHALYYPGRRIAAWPKLDLLKVKQLSFKKPDAETFKALKLAYQAGEAGGTMPAVLNAVNEEAVQLFLDEKISFLDIAELVEAALSVH